MRILIADDHSIVRAGLTRMLEGEFQNVVIGEATSCKELLQAIKAQDWGVLILDVALGAESGLGALPRVKEACPKLPVIVLSMYGERQFVMRALAEGASAYLTKERAADEELFRAIRTVCAGRRYLGEALAEQLGISVKTVSTYRTRILEKMQLETTAEIIQYAVRNGLVG